MECERVFRSVYEFCKRFGFCVELSSSFDPKKQRAWQRMSSYRFAKYTSFSDFMLRRLHKLELELKEIDNATVGFCIQGCVDKCLKEDTDAAGRELTPLIEQYYLHLPEEIKVVRVSRRPVSTDDTEQRHLSVIEGDIFRQRKDEQIALCRWESKREALDRYRMPLSAAGERPTVRVPQEDVSSLDIEDQQCRQERSPVLIGD